MSVNGVQNNGYNNYATTSSTANTQAAETAAAAETAKEETTSVPKQQTETYKPDLEKIQQMKSDLKGNMAAFKQMVYSQIKEQGLNANSSIQEILKGIQGMSQEDAIKAVADDGEWGVDATANRILDFAIALSGGDPSKVGTLRDAVQKGFDAAGKVWGGDLPEISHKTMEKVMAGFDEWEKSGSSANIGSNAQAQTNAAAQALA